MSCEECRELSTHAFRSVDDLIHAVRTAAEELNRGVLEQITGTTREANEEEALSSALASGALPPHLEYRFRCRLCGDRFLLCADTATAEGGWTREADAAERGES